MNRGPRYDLDEEQRSRVLDRASAELGAHPEVAFAYLYGSFVEGQPFHDVDVGVYLRGAPAGGPAARAMELADRLSRRLRLPVDVRILNDAPLPFVYHVLRGQLLVNHDDDLLGHVMESTIRDYLDIAPLLRLATKEAFAE